MLKSLFNKQWNLSKNKSEICEWNFIYAKKIQIAED